MLSRGNFLITLTYYFLSKLLIRHLFVFQQIHPSDQRLNFFPKTEVPIYVMNIKGSFRISDR